MLDKIIEFLNLKTAADETPWSPAHLRRVLTSDSYRHLDPRPPLRRLPTGNTVVLLRSEWEPFKKRLAEDGSREPKRTKLMEGRHQARIERERREAEGMAG